MDGSNYLQLFFEEKNGSYLNCRSMYLALKRHYDALCAYAFGFFHI